MSNDGPLSGTKLVVFRMFVCDDSSFVSNMFHGNRFPLPQAKFTDHLLHTRCSHPRHSVRIDLPFSDRLCSLMIITSHGRTVVSTIIEKGRVSRPIIGITFLESARASTLGIQKGVLVLDVTENTSAASSGLRPTTSTQASRNLPSE